MKDLRERAMLVKFKDSVWVGRRLDKKVAQKVADENKAKTHEVGIYKKRLVAKEALEERSRIGNEARIWHYRNTLPWMDDGIRILPAANVADYMQKMRKYKQAADSASAEFCRDYEKHVKEARDLLGKLFNEADYPTIGEIRRKFGFEISVMPMPDLSDWRAQGVSQKDMEELRKDAIATLVDIQTAAVQDLWRRLSETVEHVKNRLDKGDAIFRNSLIGNVKAMCEVLPKLNITDDKDLESMRKEVEEEICKLNPDELRADETMRKEAAKKAGAIMRKMEVYMGKPKKGS